MSKSIQLKNNENEKMYPHPYYPIGSIYLSVSDINPSKWFGGTWEQIAKGRTLVGVDTNDTNFNAVKKTGGNKEHYHKLPIAINNTNDNWEYIQWNNYFGYGYTDITSPNRNKLNNNAEGISLNAKQLHSETVSSLQPYFTCYIWCRTA